MSQMNKIAAMILTIIIGVGVQVFLLTIDCQNSPNRVAVEFSKAYFSLDRSMADKICPERLQSDAGTDLVDKYIYMTAQEAKARGFDVSLMRYKLYDISTETLSESGNQAQIRITGKKRVAINPVYPIVAKLFNLGSTHEVDEIIDLVKQKGQWKVCGDFFAFPTK